MRKILVVLALVLFLPGVSAVTFDLTAASEPFTGQVRGFDYSPSLGIWAGVDSNGKIASSPNGETWTSRANSGQILFDVVWSPEIGKFMTASSGPGAGVQSMYRSTNGVTWSPSNVNNQQYWESIATGHTDGRFVIANRDNDANPAYAYTTTGENLAWTTVAGSAQVWTAMTYSEFLGKFISVGRTVSPFISGQISTSTDGTSWSGKGISGSTGSVLEDIACSDELEICVAVPGDTADPSVLRDYVVTSTDGNTWTKQPGTFPSDKQFHDIHWSAEELMFIAVGPGSEIWFSNDGLEWNLATENTGASLRSVDYSAELDRWVFGTTSGVLYGSCSGCAEAPPPPTGVAAEVTKSGSESKTGIVELRWLLSVLDPDRDTGAFEYSVYLDGVKIATDTIDSRDGGGVREFRYFYTGQTTFGSANFTVTAKELLESVESCEVSVDLDELGDRGLCGLAVPATQPNAAEFEEGVEDFVTSLGFITAESRLFFTLIMVGSVTVATGTGLKFLAAGRMKNGTIFAASALVGSFATVLGYLDLWLFIVAFMLGFFAVRGAGEVRNTWFEIRSAIRREKEVLEGELDEELLNRTAALAEAAQVDQVVELSEEEEVEARLEEVLAEAQSSGESNDPATSEETDEEDA